MKTIVPASTSQSIRFWAYTTASGAPATVTSATAGIAAASSRWLAGQRLSGPTTVTLSDLAAPAAAFTSGGIIVVDAATGEHRLDVPDASLAAGADEARYAITSTSETFVVEAVELRSYHTLAVTAAGKAPATLAAGDVTGNLPADLQTIKTQAVTAAAGVTFPAAIGTSTFAGGAVASVVAAVTVGTNNDKAGYGLSPTALAAVATYVWTESARTLTGFGTLAADAATAVWAAAARTLTAFGFTVAPTAAQVRAEVEASGGLLDQVGDKVDAVGVDVGSIGTFLSDKLAGMTSLPKWLRALFRKDAADAVAKGEVNAGGGTFDEATDSAEAIRDRGDAAWATGAGGPGGGGAGDGDTAVDHDTGGSGNLAYRTAAGVGIDNATVRAYLTADYAAGDRTVRAKATTDVHGKWVAPMYLNTGNSYTFVFEKPGAYGSDVKVQTV